MSDYFECYFCNESFHSSNLDVINLEGIDGFWKCKDCCSDICEKIISF